MIIDTSNWTMDGEIRMININMEIKIFDYKGPLEKGIRRPILQMYLDISFKCRF